MEKQELKNWRKARKHFGLDKTEPYTYAMHHKDETLRHNDPERYKEWRIEDLEVMTYEEHCKHHKHCHTAETRKRISESVKKAMANIDMSEKANKSMAKFRTGKPQEYKRGNGNYRRLAVKCVETGKEYESLYEAFCDTGVTFQNINKVIKGQRKTAGGYH